jgi:hypothetical protein
MPHVDGVKIQKISRRIGSEMAYTPNMANPSDASKKLCLPLVAIAKQQAARLTSFDVRLQSP